jgi:hypothetical protein
LPLLAHRPKVEQTANTIWETVLASNNEVKKRDNNWTNKWITQYAIAWRNSTPMPRSRSAVKRWEKFSFEDGSTNNVAEYSATAIVVHGDTAVVHYYILMGILQIKANKKLFMAGVVMC